MKQIDCQLNCKATAELKDTILSDLLQEDKSLADILQEDKDGIQNQDQSEQHNRTSAT